MVNKFKFGLILIFIVLILVLMKPGYHYFSKYISEYNLGDKLSTIIISEKSHKVKAEAVNVAGEIRNIQSINVILDTICISDEMRINCFISLINMGIEGSNAVTDKLMKTITSIDKNKQIRFHIAESFLANHIPNQKNKKPQIIIQGFKFISGKYVLILDQKNPEDAIDCCLSLIWVLGNYKDEKSISALGAIVLNEEINIIFRISALLCLAEIGDKDSVAIFKQCLMNRNIDMRLLSLYGIGKVLSKREKEPSIIKYWK
jgi:hypothetical protein